VSALEFVTYGRPAPKGSKQHGGAGQFYEQSRYLPAWMDAVILAAQRARIAAKWRTATMPCVLDLVFSLDRAEHQSPDTPWLDDYPAKPPDLDKLARGVADALTRAGVWADDALWVGCDRLYKVYAGRPETWPIITGSEYLHTKRRAIDGWTGAWVKVTQLSELENNV